jgi:hypothetical protein
MGKIKVNEIEKHDATEVTVNSDVVMAAGTSVSSPSISTDTISEKTSASGVTIDGVLLKDSKIGGTITVPSSTGTMALTSDVSAITQGITAAQQWRLTANITSPTGSSTISTNLSSPTNSSFGSLGSLVSESSGIFSFSQTGYYLVIVGAMIGGGLQTHIITQLTTDNSTYSDFAGAGALSDTEGVRGGSSYCLLDITDTTNMKVRFNSYLQYAGGTIYGSTTANNTTFTFIRLGDT